MSPLASVIFVGELSASLACSSKSTGYLIRVVVEKVHDGVTPEVAALGVVEDLADPLHHPPGLLHRRVVEDQDALLPAHRRRVRALQPVDRRTKQLPELVPVEQPRPVMGPQLASLAQPFRQVPVPVPDAAELPEATCPDQTAYDVAERQQPYRMPSLDHLEVAQLPIDTKDFPDTLEEPNTVEPRRPEQLPLLFRSSSLARQSPERLNVHRTNPFGSGLPLQLPLRAKYQSSKGFSTSHRLSAKLQDFSC